MLDISAKYMMWIVMGSNIGQGGRAKAMVDYKIIWPLRLSWLVSHTYYHMEYMWNAFCKVSVTLLWKNVCIIVIIFLYFLKSHTMVNISVFTQISPNPSFPIFVHPFRKNALINLMHLWAGVCVIQHLSWLSICVCVSVFMCLCV